MYIHISKEFRARRLTHTHTPGLLDESCSVFLQLFLLEPHDDTEELVLQSLQSHGVVDDGRPTKHRRSVLGVRQLCVQVQPASSTGVV